MERETVHEEMSRIERAFAAAGVAVDRLIEAAEQGLDPLQGVTLKPRDVRACGDRAGDP